MKIHILKVSVLCLTLGAAILICFLQLKSSNSETPLPDPDISLGSIHKEKVLNLALQKRPGHVPVLLQLAQIESEKGQLREAAGHLQQIIHAEPANIEARLELGKIEFQLGDVAGALENTQAILKSNPTQPDALYNLGAIYGNLGDKERALESWNRLLSTDPNSESGKHARQLIGQLQKSTP